MDSFEMLPEHIVSEIKKFLEGKKEEYKISDNFENPILRDDVFVLLEAHSVVVYFPLEDEGNYGFHVTRTLRNKKVEFVYINTAQPLSNQIFTAGHELGHIWELDKFLSEKLEIDLAIDDLGERAMNRFAAELMAPPEVFINYLYKLVRDIPHEKQASNNSYSFELPDFIQLIIELMNKFMLPYKTIILRLLELNEIPPNLATALLDDGVRKAGVDDFISKAITASGYSKITKSTNIKVIKGKEGESFSDILNTAERMSVVDDSIIQSVRSDFEYYASVLADSFSGVPMPSITMNQEGAKADGI